MSYWVFFVAKRFFKSPRKYSNALPSLLSVVGIATGVMTLLVVLGVMNGFQHSTIEAILELNSYHLRIIDSSSIYPEIEKKIRSIPNVRALVPFAERETLLQGWSLQPQICVLRLLPKEVLSLDPSLGHQIQMVEGTFDLSDPKGILLGAELARYLGVGVGDTVQVLQVGEDMPATPVMEPFIVKGIWRSGYYEYDAGWGFLSLSSQNKTYPAEVSLGIKLQDRFADMSVQRELSTWIGSTDKIISWREYNRAIFGALRMEKTVLFILICFIFLMVAVNIYRSQQRHISARLEDIGLLKALGATPSKVQSIFMLEGTFIGILGAFWGNLMGLFLSARINATFQWVEKMLNAIFSILNSTLRVSLFSPANFYITEVRSLISWQEALLISGLAVVSTTFAAFLASKRVAVIYPAEVLRYE